MTDIQQNKQSRNLSRTNVPVVQTLKQEMEIGNVDDEKGGGNVVELDKIKSKTLHKEPLSQVCENLGFKKY
jgi:hypothetical protein